MRLIPHRLALALLFSVVAARICGGAPTGDSSAGKVLRAGIIGLDTSHVVAFTKAFNNPNASGDMQGVRIVAAFPGGSPDILSSRDRIEQFTKQLREMGVEIVDSIPALLSKVDVVLLESVDGRPHLAQVRPVFEAHKRVFIDKPLAGSLADAIAIAELGKKYDVPWFSSSSLRFGAKVRKLVDDPAVGKVMGCDTWGPCPIEPHHPDLFWYGIHGVELLYTCMGPGCETVTRVNTEGTDVVVGKWKDGRIGSFRGLRAGKEDYGAVVFGSKGVSTALGFEGYEPLVEQIAVFFKTGKPPVSPDETTELMAFMEAADQSKREGGKPVTIQSVLEAARQRANR